MNDIAVVARRVGYRVGSRKIIDNISLVLKKNEFVGLLGASGSGKTTLMTCLNGLRTPAEGEIVLNAIPIKEKERIRPLIGYVPQQDVVHSTLTVERALFYSCLLRMQTKENEVEERLDRILDLLAMQEHRKKRIRSLSGGQRKRVNIGVELLHSPPLFFLDEPTAGLDPSLDRQLMKLLRGLAQEGRMILMTTHLMQHVDLFDVLIFIHQGRLIYFGPTNQITSYFQADDMVHLFEKIMNHDAEWLEQRFLSSAIYELNLGKRLRECD